MSSWERSRYIPWSKIPKGDGKNVDDDKERIFRQLQIEATTTTSTATIETTTTTSGPDATTTITTGNNNNNNNNELAVGVAPFTVMELLKMGAFGGCIGTITGGVFGFMDSMRTVQENALVKNASNAAKIRYLLQGSTRSATLFGLFFSGFHCIKYGIHTTFQDPGDIIEVTSAGIVSVSALMYSPSNRHALPYATMLILMDSVHIFMRKTS